MQVGYRCDIGQKRKINEDSLMCVRFGIESHAGRELAGLFVVADGMGGHSAGEIASEWGVKIFVRECLRLLLEPLEYPTGNHQAIASNPKDILILATKVTNRLLFEMAKEKQAIQGMGTTITAALICGQDLYVAHVGDSRCYIISDGKVTQITKDHSLVQEMVEARLITPEEARTHPRRNVITRVVGYDQEVEPDIYYQKVYKEDNILLCSDGLWEVLSDEKIAEITLKAKTVDQACAELIRQANQQGGPDNICVIVIRPDQLPSLQELLRIETRVRKRVSK